MFEFFIEYDINPVIFFDERGNVKYCNQEAEIFLSYINVKEVYKFVINKATSDKLMNTQFQKIKFNDFEFNGFSIGYKDNLIGVRFFINTKKNNITISSLEKVDLLKLINFAIEYIKLKQNTQFKIFPDLSIREILINKKELLKILIEIFENQQKVEIITHLKVGEYLKIENKKYPIIEIKIKTHANKKISSQFFEIENSENGYNIKIPFIKEKDENSNS